MSDLKESRILLRGILYIFVPIVLFGVLAMFYPVIYTFFPVQESEGCVCNFNERSVDKNVSFLIDLDS